MPEDSLAGTGIDVWSSALSSLEGKISPRNFDIWLRPILCHSVEGSQIRLSAPNKYIRDWFELNYESAVLEALREQTAREYSLVYELREEELPAPREVVTTGSPAPAPAVRAPHRSESEFSQKYTFDTFVVGPSNQLAHAACRAAAEFPASKYNPLFIYGGVGLGKTHLIHAIGQGIRAKNPSWNILYVSSETFVNEFINCIASGKMDEKFRPKYRNVDVLLIDDIQFIAGKDRTQDEFFHTFNALFESHRQIVLTADKYPHEIPNLEERLRSRFQWGLITDISPPELETRIAILQKKAEVDGIKLPPDVATFLATNIKSNVRELEGLLIRVAAFADLQEQPITIDFARETLKNFLSQTSQALSVETVQKEVAAYFNVKIADLKSPKRHQTIARPRAVAMYLARKLCKASYPELGQRFGGKDHTTVLSACRKIDALISTDQKTRHIVEELERQLAR